MEYEVQHTNIHSVDARHAFLAGAVMEAPSLAEVTGHAQYRDQDYARYARLLVLRAMKMLGVDPCPGAVRAQDSTVSFRDGSTAIYIKPTGASSRADLHLSADFMI